MYKKTRKPQKNKTHKKNKKYRRHKGNKTISIKARGIPSLFDTTFLSDYDYNIEQVFNGLRETGIHAIDPQLAHEFIETQISPARRQAAQDLIDNTIYIPSDEIANVLEELIIKLYTENDNFSGYTDIYIISQDPSKSSYYLSVLALFFIRKHNFREPTRFVRYQKIGYELGDIAENNPILYIDDVSYSGSQLSQTLDLAYYIRNTQNKPNLNIHCLIISATEHAYNVITRVPLKARWIDKENLKLEVFAHTKSPFNILIKPERIYESLIFKLGYERYINLRLFFSP